MLVFSSIFQQHISYNKSRLDCKLGSIDPTHTKIFYNLFIPCGVINDPICIFQDLPIKVKFLSYAFILLTILTIINFQNNKSHIEEKNS